MKLYGYWRSTAAYRVRIALNLKEIPYDIVEVDLIKDGGDQHQGWYKTINPQELVPTLELDDGNVIGQSMAIIEYLEETFPHIPLLPADSLQRAQIRRMAQVIAMDIHPLNNLRVLDYLRQEIGVDQTAVSNWYHHWLKKGFSTLETLIDAVGPFAAGSSITLADVFIVPQLYNAHRFDFDLKDTPGLQRIEQSCLGLPAFSQAAPENQKNSTGS